MCENILNLGENLTKSFRGLRFLTHTVDMYPECGNVATSAFTAWYRGSCSCPASEHEPPRAGHGADATVPL